MRYSILFVLFIFMLCSKTLTGQAQTRGIAVVDFSEESQTVNSELFSAVHLVKVAGLAYTVTRDLETAFEYSMVLFSSKLTSSIFSDEQDALIRAYVAAGGTLISPIVEDEDLFDVFGISAYETDKTRFAMIWHTTLDEKALTWIDEPEEETISLGRPTLSQGIKTYGYTCTSATTLASYEDGATAVTANTYGLGRAISFGLSWKDVILRNQINRDYEAQRISSNGFEPTSDVFSLFIRGAFQAHHPHAVWLHTSPANSSATLMVTHDVDSQSGIDSLSLFVDYEEAQGIEATYNITTRYFNDALMGAFYTDSEATMAYIMDHGQIIGSHSVGHFFDYADEDIFPLGATGNTVENYQPYNDGDITTGGTVYGECELSKNILQEDLDVPITFFRTGHLAYPKKLIDVLDDLGYLYNSSSSASDVLTNFPYQNVMGRSFNGEVSAVYDLPVTISDVHHDDHISNENYKELVSTWLDVTSKNIRNGAPTVLLIHPNRAYKVDALAEYYAAIPANMQTMEITKYGDYWKAREAYDYKTMLDEDGTTLTIQLLGELDEDMSFVCNDGQLLQQIIILDIDGAVLSFRQEPWTGQDVLIYYESMVPASVTIDLKNEIDITVYPNPASNVLNINYNAPTRQKIAVELYDLAGRHVSHLCEILPSSSGQHMTFSLAQLDLTAGTYLVHFNSVQRSVGVKKVVIF